MAARRAAFNDGKTQGTTVGRFGAGRGPVFAAAITAAAMIAQQVGGKAVRDAVFLSRYPVTALPAMILATAALSVVFALLAARVLTARGPHRMIPATFAGSAGAMVLLWWFGEAFPKGQAVALYFLVSVIGMIQVSGFWSLINESYDPRTAKRRVGRIAAGGTLGGLVGGVLAERVGSMIGVDATLPLLAGLHALCAATSLAIPRPLRRPAGAARHEESPREPRGARLGARVFARTPYLRSLAALVFVSTVAAAFIDFVFKMQAARSMSGPTLLRLFAGFYTAVGIATFIVQVAVTRRVIERVGLARSVASLPLGVAAGGMVALMAPGPAGAAIARGIESVLRNSLYRSGYEILFLPIPPREKRATKAIVDVGVERIGDALAAAVAQVVLLTAALVAGPILLGLAVLCSVGGLEIARRLHRGYVATLERSLLSRARELDVSGDGAGVVNTVFLSGEISRIPWGDDNATNFLEIPRPEGPADASAGEADPLPAEAVGSGDEAFFRRVRDLVSGDPQAARRAVLEAPVDRALAPHVIALLAWEAVADAAAQALRGAVDRIVGQLVDSLTDPEEDFAIRRRIPRILMGCPSPIAVEGLLHGLLDQRFEVRFRCGRALSHLQQTVGILQLDVDRVYLPVLREVAVDRRVWESQRLLALPGDDEESIFIDSVLRERASRSLEHVFTVLSLALPREPLQVAFRGLHAEDPSLRGTALEYLESILPPHVRDALWPLLEEHRFHVQDGRTREDVLADLARDNESIVIDLRSLRRKDETP